MVNGTDAPQDWDGTTLTATSWTGPSSINNLIAVTSYNERLYFAESDSQNFWYSGSQAVTGALTSFPLSMVSKFGGYLNNIGRNAVNHNSICILCFGHGNNIHHNNFISNQENSYLETAFVNRFLNNYWTKPRIAPYPIRGVIPIPGGNEIVYYDFDPVPRVLPNTIP